MPTVRLGNEAALEGYHPDVPKGASAKDLRALAEEHGVDLSDKPNADTVAARLAALTLRRPLDEPRVTTIQIPPDRPLIEALFEITQPGRGVWDNHSAGPPTWVESDDPALEEMLSRHYGCPVGAPKDVERTHWTEAGPPGVGA